MTSCGFLAARSSWSGRGAVASTEDVGGPAQLVSLPGWLVDHGGEQLSQRRIWKSMSGTYGQGPLRGPKLAASRKFSPDGRTT